MQQLFIDMVLRQEQEAYKSEGMQWLQINYFDNKSVCDMLDAPSVVSYI
jgi:myosin-1